MDGNDNIVYRTAITLENAGAGAKVQSITGVPAGYGLNDVQTYTDGILYLYLPANTRVTSVKLVDGTIYEGTVTTTTDNNAAATFSLGKYQPEDRSATITATASIPSPTYTVTIPATVDAGDLVQKASGDTDKVKSTDLTVSAANIANLFGVKKVTVTVAPKDGAFELADSENKLAYELYAPEGTAKLSSGATFTEFTADGSKTGRIDIDQSAISRAGNYSGTLTFTISLSDVSGFTGDDGHKVGW